MVASTTLCNTSEEESADALESSWFYFEAGIESNCSLLVLISVEKHAGFFLYDLNL